MRGQGRGAALQLPQPTSLNLGILAYARKSEALVQIAVGGDTSGRKVKGAGRAGFALLRNRILVAVDRATARVFGAET